MPRNAHCTWMAVNLPGFFSQTQALKKPPLR